MTDPNRRPLRVLIVEDRESDAALMVGELRRGGFDCAWHRVDSEAEFIARLEPSLDVILADFSMPGFSAPRALDLVKERALEIPFIVVSGSIEEETAVRVLKQGAADYLLKDRLGRLAQAVQRALDEHGRQQAQREGVRTLRDTEERMR